MAGAAIMIKYYGYTEFAEACAAFPEILSEALAPYIQAAGELVAAAAIGDISPYSRSIPPGISASPVSPLVSRVTATAPLSGILNAQRLRHPVFGNTKVWVTQATHPFMQPALDKTEDAVMALLERGLQEALDVVAARTNESG